MKKLKIFKKQKLIKNNLIYMSNNYINKRELAAKAALDRLEKSKAESIQPKFTPSNILYGHESSICEIIVTKTILVNSIKTQLIISLSDDGSIFIWNIKDGTCLRHEKKIFSFLISKFLLIPNSCEYIINQLIF